MLMKRLLPLLCLLFPVLACAHAWKVDSATSTLGFSGSYDGEVFHGRFKHFDARIDYDPGNLKASSFEVTVRLDSVDTQSTERDETLTGADFFDTDTHPTAHFVTRSFSRDGDGHVTAQGSLTLNGITRPVTLTVTFAPEGKGATLDVKTTLKRLDFKLGTGSDWDAISRDIPVHGHLQLH